ncbi:MAG TPA: fatty acid desaturase [Acidimicrobiales bacterium]|nr:fatty acid desaturase [Acidimicrobiales bacterium]
MPEALLAVLVGLAVCQIGIVCTTVFLHRTVAHRAVTMSAGVRFVFRFLIWITTGIRPRQWAAVHRRHHAFTDVEGDPHSPLLLGFWKVQLANAALYRRCARDGETVDRYAKDLPPDRWDRALFDHAFVGLGIGIAILCVSLGWQYGLVAAAVHTVSYLLLNGAINAFGHVLGTEPYENTARNNQWLAWLTAGEGLHNNHHAAPTAARLSHAKREMDPGWWLIRALAALGQARVRLAEPKLVPTTGRAVRAGPVSVLSGSGVAGERAEP